MKNKIPFFTIRQAARNKLVSFIPVFPFVSMLSSMLHLDLQKAGKLYKTILTHFVLMFQFISILSNILEN